MAAPTAPPPGIVMVVIAYGACARGACARMDAVTTLTLISKPDCHLCDVAREVIDVVISELPESDVEVAELSILDDPALYATWWEKIPAVLIDDRLHAHWRLDAARLRAALDAAASRAPDAISVSESTPAPAPEEDPA